MRAKIPRAQSLRNAFTLIEIMIVVGIMGIIATMGVPMVYKAFRKEPFTKAITSVVEVCSHARARAIMQGAMTEVVFHPREGRFEVSGGSVAAPSRHQEGDPGAFDVHAAPISG